MGRVPSTVTTTTKRRLSVAVSHSKVGDFHQLTCLSTVARLKLARPQCSVFSRPGLLVVVVSPLRAIVNELMINERLLNLINRQARTRQFVSVAFWRLFSCERVSCVCACVLHPQLKLILQQPGDEHSKGPQTGGLERKRRPRTVETERKLIALIFLSYRVCTSTSGLLVNRRELHLQFSFNGQAGKRVSHTAGYLIQLVAWYQLKDQLSSEWVYE